MAATTSVDLDIEEALTVFEESEDAGVPEDNPSTCSTKPKGKAVVTLTKDTLQKVIASVCTDPIMMMATSLECRQRILKINVGELTETRTLLNSCLKPGVFISSSKEKAWARFYSCQRALLSSINPSIQHSQLSSFIVLKAMEELLSINYHPLDSSKPSTDLSEEEADIISYIGGFVLFRSKKYFSNDNDCLSLIYLTIKGEGEDLTGKLILTKTRGGLCEPKDDMISFFKFCEEVFRGTFSSFEHHSLQGFIDAVCCREEVLSLFYHCTYHHNINVKTQETILLHVLGVFFRLRCHAKCKNVLEKYLLKTKTSRKEKALRKTLSNN